VEAIVLGPAEGERLSVAGDQIVFKAEAADTGGALGLIEYTAAADSAGPPLHLHREMSETFFVLEGTHTFSNQTSDPVRFLALMAPGGFERYFKELAAAFGDGPPDPTVAREVAASYDIEPA
jgi:hypothetical protein